MFSNAKKKLQDVVDKHTERKLEMQRVSEILGIDVSFSEEELLQSIEEDMAKYYGQIMIKEMTAWMK